MIPLDEISAGAGGRGGGPICGRAAPGDGAWEDGWPAGRTLAGATAGAGARSGTTATVILVSSTGAAALTGAGAGFGAGRGGTRFASGRAASFAAPLTEVCLTLSAAGLARAAFAFDLVSTGFVAAGFAAAFFTCFTRLLLLLGRCGLAGATWRRAVADRAEPFMGTPYPFPWSTPASPGSPLSACARRTLPRPGMS